MGALTRATSAWLDRMSKFHMLISGNAIDKQPIVNNDKKLNYYRLKCIVDQLGGFEEVTRTNSWPIVCAKLELSIKSDLKTAFHVYSLYQSFILPFEDYLDQVAHSGLFNDSTNTSNEGLTASLPSSSSKNPAAVTTSIKPEVESSNADEGQNDSIDDFETTAASNRKRRKVSYSRMGRMKTSRYTAEQEDGDDEKEIQEEQETNKNGHSPKGKRNSIYSDGNDTNDTTTNRKNNDIESQDEYDECAVCKMLIKEQELECQHPDCERCYHFVCLGSLSLISKKDHSLLENWYCPRCLLGTGEFFFDEGEEYTLDEFKDKADEFREKYFDESLPIVNLEETNQDVLENLVEERFWNHVDDLNCELAVEYGADVQSDVLGSGFAKITDHARDPYSKDMWNLNNFPKHKKSLFNMIKDISGVTTPWGYVGMMFSTFCWHSEDHYTFSVNYQHCGNTKTWYGIPGSYAEDFEKASRDTVPELFAKQPDILFQRATMVSPEILQQHNVPVYVCDQHAGQFVITFPKAYHSGFNHGFNYNEAVNYAPPEWVPFGQESVVSYRIQKRSPLFSHDRLMLKTAQSDKSEATAIWLHPHLVKLAQQEDLDRKRVKRLFPDVQVELIQSDATDDRVYQCCVCNSISYLSRVVLSENNQSRTAAAAEAAASNGANHKRANRRSSTALATIENDAMRSDEYKVYCLHHLPDPKKVSPNTVVTLEMRMYSRSLKALCDEVKDRIDVESGLE